MIAHYFSNVFINLKFSNIVLRPLYEVILILWTVIDGYINYSINNFGTIQHIKKGTTIKAYVTPNKYLSVSLQCVLKKRKHLFIHRLVAIAFIPNPFKNPTVNHLNYNSLDNYVGNLAWCTQKEQNVHKRPKGTHPKLTLLMSPSTLVFSDIPAHLVGNASGFQISNSGRIRYPSGRVSTGEVCSYDIPRVKINGHRWSLHRLLGVVCIPNPSNLPEINHLDGNKLNCVLGNLEWSTSKGNSKHAWDTGLSKRAFKPVLQFSNDGLFIKEFASVKSAMQGLGLSSGSFYKYMKGTKKNGLFILKYK